MFRLSQRLDLGLSQNLEEDKEDEKLEANKVGDSDRFPDIEIPEQGIDLDEFNRLIDERANRMKKQKKDNSDDDIEILPKIGFQVTWNPSKGEKGEYVKVRKVWYDQKV